ncbi:c-type cytochrome [Paracoccus versutus]|uniref:Thiosulfate dehydrogenase n=2 Tax=Paracoccus versutus TaxID=34007 RepID=A0A3D9XSD7_PARVE|nr:c-type cytochrome [Paracoccus versutus]REF73364.1 thiosulfate dehydrogenase [Paracoccus versutus]WGR54616.1 c-type cytochrome [Paracoccus versutus]
MKKPVLLIAGVAVLALGVWGILRGAPADVSDPQGMAILDAEGNVVGDYTVPADRDILAQPNADQILYGKRLLADTARLLPDNVGAAMNCNSCHLGDGKIDAANGYINTVNFYPRVMPRAGKEVDLEMRINGCFQRSMNGKPLDPDGPEMKAMIAYMDWLRQDVPKDQTVDIVNAGPIDESLLPDPENGKRIYAAKCAACHGADGEGMRDQSGDILFPPLWGEESFNIGAGMARTYKAAQFVRWAMPPAMHMGGQLGQGGVLSDQEAVDVSEYFTHMPRPDFPGKVNDWPNGNRPKDARY